jgi:transcriptional regulator of acetoin/glycerol metabolism
MDVLGHHFGGNVLLVGAQAAAKAVELAAGLFQAPYETRQLPGPLSLPSAQRGTLVLQNVGLLDPDQQSSLLLWLDANPEVRVVSVHPSPVFELVTQGVFSDRLYYRLNTVLMSDPVFAEETLSAVTH